jgi:hypothetical protein
MPDDKPPREKKSWREIDAGRDRGGAPVRKPVSPRERQHDQQKSKQHRAALDALFEQGGFAKVAKALGHEPVVEAPPRTVAADSAGGAPAPAPVQVDEARVAMRKKIVEAIGRDEVSRAVDRYLAKWPLPDDWEVLEQVLDHTDEARVEEAFSKLEAKVAREKPRRARTMIGRLRYIEETSGSDSLRERATALRGKLG